MYWRWKGVSTPCPTLFERRRNNHEPQHARARVDMHHILKKVYMRYMLYRVIYYALLRVIFQQYAQAARPWPWTRSYPTKRTHTLMGTFLGSLYSSRNRPTRGGENWNPFFLHMAGALVSNQKHSCFLIERSMTLRHPIALLLISAFLERAGISSSSKGFCNANEHRDSYHSFELTRPNEPRTIFLYSR